MPKLKKSGEPGARTPGPPATPGGRTPSMATQSYSDLNGEDKTPPMFPAFREFIGRVRAGWIVAVILISGVMHFASVLIANDWLIGPAKAPDLQALKAETAAQFSANIREHQEMKAILGDLQKSQMAVIIKLTEIATILSERSASAPAVPAPPPHKTAIPRKPDNGLLGLFNPRR